MTNMIMLPLMVIMAAVAVVAIVAFSKHHNHPHCQHLPVHSEFTQIRCTLIAPSWTVYGRPLPTVANLFRQESRGNA